MAPANAPAATNNAAAPTATYVNRFPAGRNGTMTVSASSPSGSADASDSLVSSGDSVVSSTADAATGSATSTGSASSLTASARRPLPTGVRGVGRASGADSVVRSPGSVG